MSRLPYVAIVCSMLTLLGTAHGAVCPEVTADGASCQGSFDCTELQCQLQANGLFVNGTSSISVDPCNDPPKINFTLQWLMNNGTFVIKNYLFSESGIELVAGPVSVSATVKRNATSLSFSARSVGAQDNIDLVPWVQYDINTTECLCSSVEELAEKIHSPAEHDCSATPTCDGVTCELEVFGNTLTLETDVLSCTTPPAFDVIVKDSSGTPIYTGVYDDNSTGTINIAGFVLPISVLLIQRPYSIEIEANLTVPFYGTINIVPRHTIILDLSSCSTQPSVNPPTAVPTMPPSPTPPPSDAPYLCHTLYNLANTTGTELNCLVASSCTELKCELSVDTYFYELNLLVLPRENSVKARIRYRSIHYHYELYQDEQWDVVEGNQEQAFQVTESSNLSVKASATGSTLTIQMTFRLAGQPDKVLVPQTSINLPSAEGCLWWLPAVENVTECSYLLDCQGIRCVNYGTVDSSSVFIGERCADPIAVQLELVNHNNVVVFRGNFTETSSFQPVLDQEMYTGYMSISRSDTELSVSASYRYSDFLKSLVPRVTIPLDQQYCSCQSLAELAKKTQSPLEHNCTTNEACNGIRCELEIFGTFFYLESLLLSCNSPPALETVVEDKDKKVLHTSVVSRTGAYSLSLLGLELPTYVEITHHDYSMDISTTVLAPLFGNLTVIPPHTLFLDRSSCPNAIPPPATPPPNPSPPTYPDASTPTCQGLVDIAKEKTQEPFICQVATDTGTAGECDSLICQLDVGGSSYTMTLGLYPQGAEYAALVKVESENGVLENVEVEEGETLSVLLKEGTLVFDFQALQGNALAIKATITLSSGRSSTLIDSEVPLEEKGSPEASSSSDDGVKIGVPVVVVLVCAAALTTIVLTSIWLWRRRQKQRQFEFKPMKFSDVQDSSEKEAEAMEAPENAYEPIDSSPTTSE